MSENKTRPTAISVADFLKKKASAERLADCKELVRLFRDVTGKPPKIWGPSIVGFDSYHYIYDSGREGDAPVVGFALRGREIVLYLAITKETKPLLAKLGKHKSSVACVYIRTLDDLDRGVLKKLAQAAVKETRRRYPARKAG